MSIFERYRSLNPETKDFIVRASLATVIYVGILGYRVFEYNNTHRITGRTIPVSGPDQSFPSLESSPHR